MKKLLSAILFAVLLVVGLGSCERECSNVLPEPTTLTLNPSTVALKMGTTQQLTATVEPTDQTYTVTFTSDNEKVATVNDKGLVTAVAEGTANITASVGNLTAKSVVTVSNSAPDVTLTVKTPTLTIEKGKTAQIDYTVTPADTPVTFTSDKTDIATVDAQGVVTAVAAGSATITVAAAGQEAQVAVTVTEDNGGGGTATQSNELPLLKFEVEYGQSGLIDSEVIAYEKKVGRTAQPFKLWNQGPFEGGFVNKNLTIMGVIYGLTTDSEYLIPAFSNESLANCPKTLAMLAEYGFTNLEDQKFKDGTPLKYGVKNDDKTIEVEVYDEPNDDLGSSLIILFSKPMEKKGIEISHTIIPNAKDFPDYATFIMGDLAKTKSFEEKLGFREYNSRYSNEKKQNLMFVTTESSISRSNLSLAYYVYTPEHGSRFIHTFPNCIKNEEDFADPKLKEWFTANGYGNNFYASTTEKVGFGFDATGKFQAQIFINDSGDAAILQIFEKDNGLPVAQMRSLAMKQYNKMKFLTKTKHRKLQQLRRL